MIELNLNRHWADDRATHRYIGREIRKTVAELDAMLPRRAVDASDICEEIERSLPGALVRGLAARSTLLSEESWGAMLILPRALLRLAALRIREARHG